MGTLRLPAVTLICAKYDFQVVGWFVKSGLGTSWDVMGRFHCLPKTDNADLFMAPTERKEWIVRYFSDQSKDHVHVSGPYENFDSKNKGRHQKLKCLQLSKLNCELFSIRQKEKSKQKLLYDFWSLNRIKEI